LAAKIVVPFTITDVVSSANTESVALVIVPVRSKVWVNVTLVPFGTTTNPGSDGLPVSAKEIQFEPASAPAQAGFDDIFCVALPELLLVLLAELSSDEESALAVKKQPLATTAKANVISFFILCCLRVRP